MSLVPLKHLIIKTCVSLNCYIYASLTHSAAFCTPGRTSICGFLLIQTVCHMQMFLLTGWKTVVISRASFFKPAILPAVITQCVYFYIYSFGREFKVYVYSVLHYLGIKPMTLALQAINTKGLYIYICIYIYPSASTSFTYF